MLPPTSYFDIKINEAVWNFFFNWKRRPCSPTKTHNVLFQSSLMEINLLKIFLHGIGSLCLSLWAVTYIVQRRKSYKFGTERNYRQNESEKNITLIGILPYFVSTPQSANSSFTASTKLLTTSRFIWYPITWSGNRGKMSKKC